MWNYPLYFSQDAVVLSSTDPCNYETYIGPEAASEPETQNVISIIDSNPHIRYFIDLHSSGEDILYSWGDSEDQTTDEDMNFHNHRFDGLRGDKSYKEFISSTANFIHVISNAIVNRPRESAPFYYYMPSYKVLS